MPLPNTKNIGTIFSKLKKEGGKPRKQMIAIALNQARKSGASIPKKALAMRARAIKSQ